MFSTKDGCECVCYVYYLMVYFQNVGAFLYKGKYISFHLKFANFYYEVMNSNSFHQIMTE